MSGRIVTKILALSKTRNRIYIDEQFAFVLYKGELRTYQIKEGQEINEEYYREIMTKVLPKRAKLRSMNLLQKREYTEAQLRTKLEQGGYPENVIEEAVAYVKDYGYIDDSRYAAQYIAYQTEFKSCRKIKMDLYKKGIKGEIVEEQFSLLQEKELPDEEKMIRRLLEKRHYDSKTADMKEKQRTYAYLCRKGFETEAIRRVMKLLDIT